MKTLLIGTGLWAENHLKAMQRCRRMRIAGIVGHSNEARLNELADRYAIPYRSMNVTKAIADVGPDIVDIAGSPRYRLAGVTACVGTGVRLVNIEKPMALTPREGYAIEKVCRASGLLLTVNHQKKFNAPWAKAASLIRGGRLGSLRFFRATCRGNLLEQGTHLVDMLLFFHGYTPLQWVMSQVADLEGLDKEKTPAPDSAAVELRFTDGVHASVLIGNIGWAIPRETNKWFQFSVEAYGTRGHLVVTLNQTLEVVTYADGRRVKEPSKWDDTWVQGLADHLDACARYAARPGAGHVSCLDNSMKSFEAVMAIAASAAGGGRIPLPCRIDDGALRRLHARRAVQHRKGNV